MLLLLLLLLDVLTAWAGISAAAASPVSSSPALLDTITFAQPGTRHKLQSTNASVELHPHATPDCQSAARAANSRGPEGPTGHDPLTPR
jgi:hypothetical protein